MGSEGVSSTSETWEWLGFAVDLPGVAPEDALPWLMDARLVNQWWGNEAVIESRLGGAYHVHFTAMNWTMRRTIAAAGPTWLVYSWAWDHEPLAPARSVVVQATPTEGGCVLELCHGPFSATPEVARDEEGERALLHEGWLSFLPKLRAKILVST